MLCKLVIPSDFFQYLFRRLIMNIECETITEHIDNSKDDYRGYTQKMMILKFIKQIFREMLIGGSKIVNSDIFSESLISGHMFKMILQSLKGYF